MMIVELSAPVSSRPEKSFLAAEEGAAAAVQPLIKECASQVSEAALDEHLLAIHASDVRSTFTAYNETAAFARACLQRYGLDEVEEEAVPADGRTRLGDWIAPLAWDAREGVLERLGPDGALSETLCRYTQCPDSLILGSAPTPGPGVVAELVLAAAGSPFPEDVRGWVVFTDRRAKEIKPRVARAGGLGIVSCFHPAPEEDPASIYWNNSWSDRPGGWWATAADARLFGFSVSPLAGGRLRRELSAGRRVRVRARVETSLHRGTLPFVSGLLRGTDPAAEEILLLSHLYERGAHDNASGCAVNLEVARILSRAVATGRLPRPRRGLRFLFMAECYGLLAYMERRRARCARTRAAVCLDGVGAAWPLRIHAEPDCARSPLAPWFAAVARAVWPPASGRRCELAGPLLGDTLLSDPLVGVPTIWPHRASLRKSWHTTLDTPERVDRRALREMAAVTGAFLWSLADPGAAVARGMAEGCVRRFAGRAATLPPERLAYEAAMEQAAVRRIRRLVPGGGEGIAAEAAGRIGKRAARLGGRPRSFGGAHGAGGQRVFRRWIPGVLSLDPLPEALLAARGYFPRWSLFHTAVYWWVNGRRTLSEIIALVESAFPGRGGAARDYLEFLHAHGRLAEQTNPKTNPHSNAVRTEVDR